MQSVTQNTFSACSTCKWSPWCQWSKCSKTCGTGSQERTRTISKPAQYEGEKCVGKSKETRVCNEGKCPGMTTTWCQKVNSHVNDLKKYSTTKNAPGWTINVKYVKSKMFNGAYWRGCDGDNSWFGWGGNGYIETTLHGCGRARLDFGNCAQCKVSVQLCGKTIATHCFASKTIEFDFKEGDVLRLSHCTSKGGIIKFNSFKVIHCCSTCKWSPWCQWSKCSKTCGTGSQERTRTISKPAKYEGEKCVGKSKETRVCNGGNCPGMIN